MGALGAALPTPLGGDSTVNPTPVVDVTTSAALDRLALQFRDRPNLVSLLTGLVTKSVELELVATQLQGLPSFDSCVGKQLDVLGAILGEPRDGFDDVTYRLHLKARVWLNRGSGTGEDIYSLFSLLLGPAVVEDFQLVEFWPASFSLRYWAAQLFQPLAGYLVIILHEAKAAGVDVNLHWLDADPTASFCFSGGPGLGFDAGIWSSAE